MKLTASIDGHDSLLKSNTDFSAREYFEMQELKLLKIAWKPSINQTKMTICCVRVKRGGSGFLLKKCRGKTYWSVGFSKSY